MDSLTWDSLTGVRELKDHAVHEGFSRFYPFCNVLRPLGTKLWHVVYRQWRGSRVHSLYKGHLPIYTMDNPMWSHRVHNSEAPLYHVIGIGNSSCEQETVIQAMVGHSVLPRQRQFSSKVTRPSWREQNPSKQSENPLHNDWNTCSLHPFKNY